MIPTLSATRTEKKDNRILWIRENVDYSGEKRGQPYTFHGEVSFLDCQLPNLTQLGPQLREMYIPSVVDEDMKADLEDSGALGWTPLANKLIPVCVSRNGNCLLHSASVAVWSVEDSRGTLRDLMLMSVKNSDNFKKRWRCQMLRDMESLEGGNSEITNQEWEDVIRCIRNLGSNNLSQAVPHRFLESAHIYILANILRRPIIIVADSQARSFAGQTLQENNIAGLYLPLEWPPIDCCKTPIILGYSFSHFCPLLSEAGSRPPRGKENCLMFPLVKKDLGFMPVRYITMEEDHKAWDLVQLYLIVKEVNISNTTPVKVPFAQVNLKPLASECNVLYDHLEMIKMRLAEAEFLEASRGKVYSTLGASARNRHPFYDIEMNSQTVPLRSINVPGQDLKSREATAAYIQNEIFATPVKCITEGCNNEGSAYHNDFCPDCFQILSTARYNTVSVSENEENVIRNQIKIPAEDDDEKFGRLDLEVRPGSVLCEALTPTAPPESLESHTQQPSMMVERCVNRCGYRCSIKTYPYCHECFAREMQRENSTEQGGIYPSMKLGIQTTQPNPDKTQANAEILTAQPNTENSQQRKADSENTQEEVTVMQDPTASNLKSPIYEPLFSSLGELNLSLNLNSLENKLSSQSGSFNSSMLRLRSHPSENASSTEASLNTLDQNCKNFHICHGHKMLDNEMCNSCAEKYRHLINIEENIRQVASNIKNYDHKIGHAVNVMIINKPGQVMRHEQKTAGKHSVTTEPNLIQPVVPEAHAEIIREESSTETNMKNVTGDVEVSEEPVCRVKCANPYCQTFIDSPEKLCSKCMEILRPGHDKSGQPSEASLTSILRLNLDKSGQEKETSSILRQGQEKSSQSREAPPISPITCRITADQYEKEKEFKKLVNEPPPSSSTISKTQINPSKDYIIQDPKAGALETASSQRRQISKGKPCIVPSCTRFGDPSMDNKCSSCFYGIIPGGKSQTTSSATTKMLATGYPKPATHTFTQQPQNSSRTRILNQLAARTAPVQTSHVTEPTNPHPIGPPDPLHRLYTNLNISFQELGPDISYMPVQSALGPDISYMPVQSALGPEISYMPVQSALSEEPKSLIVTSKTRCGDSSEHQHHLPANSSYSFSHQSLDRDLEKTYKEIEKASKGSIKKCLSAACQNYGNKDKKGYCNSCYKAIKRQQILLIAATEGKDVPDSNTQQLLNTSDRCM